MIKLNRTTEYGLIALRHMSRKAATNPPVLTSAREVADSYGIPFEITAKTLQKLKDTGLIQSAYGARGGYTLLKPLSQISLGEFLTLMEGPQTLVACTSGMDAPADQHANDCEYGGRCEIKGLMGRLNSKIHLFLSKITLAELAEDSCQQQTWTLSAVASVSSTEFSGDPLEEKEVGIK